MSTPFGAAQTTLMGRCTTSLTDPNYTMIDIWHVATANIIYRGVMSGGVVGHWYQIDITQKT